MDSDNRIVLNVGGIRHETYNHVLKKIPATRLSRLSPNLGNYDPILNEYFFDRHPETFEMILNYYRTGKLHYPTNVCGPLFEEELDYWGLDSNQVEPCCWMTYTLFRDTQETLQVINNMKLDYGAEKMSQEEIAQQFGWETDFFAGNMNWWKKIKPKMWSIFDEPRSSQLARLTNSISTVLVLLSIISFAGRTLPMAKIPHITMIIYSEDLTFFSSAIGDGLSSSSNYNPIALFQTSNSYNMVCYYAELFCNTWFAFELISRMMFCPDLHKFLKSPLTIIDLVAITSFMIDSVVMILMTSDTVSFLDSMGSQKILEFIAIVRILRLFKLAQHYTPFKVLVQTFKASSRVLMLILFFVILFVVLLAAFVYYAERLMLNPNNKITDIFKGLWWSMITLTTIGYGDYVPYTFTGQIVGSIAALASVLVVAFPVPVIVTNFSNLYLHMRARAKLPKKRRRVLQAHELKPILIAPTGGGNPTFKAIHSPVNDEITEIAENGLASR